MEQRLEFFDSNVLIAASLPAHTHHTASTARLLPLQAGGGAMGAHSLAEAYNNLTNQRNGYLLPPADAAILVSHAAKIYSIVTLTAAETTAAISAVANLGREGAIVFDALLLACARKIDAKAIYTWNVRHFRQIAPDLASRIFEP